MEKGEGKETVTEAEGGTGMEAGAGVGTRVRGGTVGASRELEVQDEARVGAVVEKGAEAALGERGQ